MAKQPLTTAGVSAKQSELFILGQAALDNQSFSLATNFKAWMNDNFELTTQEQNFLNTANDAFIRKLSSIIFVAVRNRIPFDFTKSMVVTAAKRFETQAKFDFKYTWGGSLDNSDLLKLNIVYL